VLRPVDTQRLVVARRLDAERDVSSPKEQLVGKEVARVVRRAIGGIGIDLPRFVEPLEKALAPAPARIAANDDHVALERRPLKLNADETRAD
jgi:hypothetical protein